MYEILKNKPLPVRCISVDESAISSSVSSSSEDEDEDEDESAVEISPFFESGSILAICVCVGSGSTVACT